MPDEQKQESNVVEVKQTVEVLDANGGTLKRDTPLADIFDKIEAGKEDGKTASEVIKESASKPITLEKKEEPAKKEAAAEVKEEVKSDRSDLDKKLDSIGEAKDAAEALKRDSEKPKVEPVVEKKEEKKEVDPNEVPDSELKVLPHDKPATVKRIQGLLKKIETIGNEATTTKKEKEEKEAKIAELEKKLSETTGKSAVLDDSVKKQLDELAMFRRRYELDNDPEVKTKFDTRVEQSEKSVIDLLTRRGAGEPLLKMIKEEGGWNKFADSTRVVPLNDGTNVSASELADTILKQLPLGERKQVEAAMMEQIQTKRDRDRYFSEEQAKANDYFKNREASTTKEKEEYNKRINEAAQTIEKWQKDVVDKNDWLKPKDVPANASEEQKKAISEDNRYTAQLNALLKKSLNVKDLNESLDMVLDSVRFYQERREKVSLAEENKKLKADLAAKQSEIDKFKGASRTTPKAGSLNGGGGATDNSKNEDKIPKSLEAAFDSLARGEVLTRSN